MPPSIIQFLLGIGVGLLGIFLVKRIREGPQAEAPHDKSEFVSQPSDFCAICTLNLETSANITYIKCGHAMHDDCLRELKKYDNKCPSCRRIF